MKAKIILQGNDLIFSLDLKNYFELNNINLNVRFESEDTVDEIIRQRQNEILVTDVDLDEFKRAIKPLLNVPELLII